MKQEDFDGAFDMFQEKSLEGEREDCRRIIQVGKDALDINLTVHQAFAVWKRWSRLHAASWLFIRDGAKGVEEIVDATESFVREFGE